MKSIKTAIAAIATLASTIAFGGGLYIVSGGDFREPRLKYVVETTNDNQTVEITPTKLRTMGVYEHNRQNFGTPWSVKMGGIETIYAWSDCIGQNNTSGNPGLPGESIQNSDTGATNVFPLVVDFPTPRTRLVKLYDDSFNIYQVSFQNNKYLTSLQVNWEDNTNTKATQQINVSYCSNLVNFVWNNQQGVNVEIPNYTFLGLPNLVNLKIAHPEKITRLGHNSFNELGMTNDLVFANVTFMTQNACRNLPNVHYASVPSTTTLQGMVFNNGSVAESRTKQQGLGLYKIRISDKITTWGQNVLYGHENLTTIEYVSDEEDWIAKWNSSVLGQAVGTAVAVEGNSNEATLTPFVGADGTYYTGKRRPGSNSNIIVRIVVIRGE